MKDRQCMQKPVRFGESPGLDQRLGISEKVAMRQHDSLRHAGGARRIQKCSKIVRVPVQGSEFRR